MEIFLTSLFVVLPPNFLRVAVVDTGLPLKTYAPVCAKGHKTFSDRPLADTYGHATNMANAIASVAGQDGYCLVFYKFTGSVPKALSASSRIARAFNEARRAGVAAINMSGGGFGESKYESEAVKRVLDAGITVFAAAGNEGVNIDEVGYFPATSDPRVTVVSCAKEYGTNYGKSVDLIRPCEYTKTRGKGSSYATAFATGEFIIKRLEK